MFNNFNPRRMEDQLFQKWGSEKRACGVGMFLVIVAGLLVVLKGGHLFAVFVETSQEDIHVIEAPLAFVVDSGIYLEDMVSTCENLGAHLFSIHNEKENEFLHEMCETYSSRDCWVGLKRVAPRKLNMGCVDSPKEYRYDVMNGGGGCSLYEDEFARCDSPFALELTGIANRTASEACCFCGGGSYCQTTDRYLTFRDVGQVRSHHCDIVHNVSECFDVCDLSPECFAFHYLKRECCYFFEKSPRVLYRFQNACTYIKKSEVDVTTSNYSWPDVSKYNFNISNQLGLESETNDCFTVNNGKKKWMSTNCSARHAVVCQKTDEVKFVGFQQPQIGWNYTKTTENVITIHLSMYTYKAKLNPIFGHPNPDFDLEMWWENSNMATEIYTSIGIDIPLGAAPHMTNGTLHIYRHHQSAYTGLKITRNGKLVVLINTYFDTYTHFFNIDRWKLLKPMGNGKHCVVFNSTHVYYDLTMAVKQCRSEYVKHRGVKLEYERLRMFRLNPYVADAFGYFITEDYGTHDSVYYDLDDSRKSSLVQYNQIIPDSNGRGRVIVEGGNVVSYLLMELMDGTGDQLRVLHKEFNSKVQTPSSRKAFFLKMEYITSGALRDIVKAQLALNELNLFHKDLKGDNILYRKISEWEYEWKLADLESCKIINDINGTRINYVSQNSAVRVYRAPEYYIYDVANGTYDARSDTYATGVFVFSLLADRYPFEGRFWEMDISAYKERLILFKDLDKCEDCFDGLDLSLNARDVLSKLLKLSPDDRIQYNELLKHPWITNRTRHDSNVQLNNM